MKNNNLCKLKTFAVVLHSPCKWLEFVFIFKILTSKAKLYVHKTSLLQILVVATFKKGIYSRVCTVSLTLLLYTSLSFSIWDSLLKAFVVKLCWFPPYSGFSITWASHQHEADFRYWELVCILALWVIYIAYLMVSDRPMGSIYGILWGSIESLNPGEYSGW